MTVHIDPIAGFLIVVACVVGYFVYKQTRQGPLGKGDIVGAIVCGTSVLTALVLVLGGNQPDIQRPEPAGRSDVPSTSTGHTSRSDHEAEPDGWP